MNNLLIGRLEFYGEHGEGSTVKLPRTPESFLCPSKSHSPTTLEQLKFNQWKDEKEHKIIKFNVNHCSARPQPS